MLESHLCSICFEQYATPATLPRILGCRHTLCEPHGYQLGTTIPWASDPLPDESTGDLMAVTYRRPPRPCLADRA